MNRSRYFTRDHVKLISPSTQMLALENDDIPFFVKHYGNTQDKFTESKIRQLEENAKYFMGQVQPLIDENYKLKDTIMNMNSALRLAHELAIELVRKENPKGESRESKLQTATLEQLSNFTKEDMGYDNEQICEYQKKQAALQTFIMKLQLQIEELQTYNAKYKQETDEELKNKIQSYVLRDQEMVEKVKVLELKLFEKENENVNLQFTIDKQEKQLAFLNAQIVELKKKIEEVQRNLVTQDKRNAIERQELQKKQFEELKSVKLDYGREINELRQRYQNRIVDLEKSLTVKEELVEELDQKLRDEMRKSGWEIQQLELDYKKLCSQFDELKTHELSSLEKLAQLMTEKREKDSELTIAEENLSVALDELRQTKLSILDNQKRMDEIETNYRNQLIEIKQNYDKKLTESMMQFREEKEADLKKHSFELSKMKHEHEEELYAINLSKASRIDELTREIEILIHKNQDFESEMKALEDSWNFKYVTMEVKLQRQINDIEYNNRTQLREREKVWQSQQNDNTKLIEDKYIELINQMEKKYNIQIDKIQQKNLENEINAENTIRQLKDMLHNLNEEFQQHQKKSVDVQQRLQQDNETLIQKNKSVQSYHEEMMIQAEQKSLEKVTNAQKSMMKQMQQVKETYEQKFEQQQKELLRLQSLLEQRTKERERSLIESRSITPQSVMIKDDKICQTNDIMIVELAESLSSSGINQELVLKQELSLAQSMLAAEQKSSSFLGRKVNQLEGEIESLNQKINKLTSELKPESQEKVPSVPEIKITSQQITPKGSTISAANHQRHTGQKGSQSSSQQSQYPSSIVSSPHATPTIGPKGSPTMQFSQESINQVQVNQHSKTEVDKNKERNHENQKQHTEKNHPDKSHHQLHDKNIHEKAPHDKKEFESQKNSSNVQNPNLKSEPQDVVPQKSSNTRNIKQSRKSMLQPPITSFQKSKHEHQHSKTENNAHQNIITPIQPIEELPQENITKSKTSPSVETQTIILEQQNDECQTEPFEEPKIIIKEKEIFTEVIKEVEVVKEVIVKPTIIQADIGVQTHEITERSPTQDEDVGFPVMRYTKPHSLEISSQNSLDLFDNQIIVERVRQEYDQKFQILKESIRHENYQLQLQMELMEKDQSSKQEQYQRQMNLLQMQLQSYREGKSQANEDMIAANYKELIDENNLLKDELNRFKNEELPLLVRQYERQIDRLKQQQNNSSFKDYTAYLEPQMNQVNEIVNLSATPNKSVAKSNKDSLREEEEPLKQVRIVDQESNKLLARIEQLQFEKQQLEQKLRNYILFESSKFKPSEATIQANFDVPPKQEKNFLSKINREFQTIKAQLSNDTGDNIDLSQLIDYHSNRNIPSQSHPLSPVQPRFVNSLRPKAKLELGESWEKLPNYFVDQTTRELKTQSKAREKRSIEPDIPLLTNLCEKSNIINYEEKQLMKAYIATQFKARPKPLEEMLKMKFELEDNPFPKQIEHYDPRTSLHSKQTTRQKPRMLIRKRRHPSAEQMKEPAELKIEGVGNKQENQKSRQKHPGFIEYLKMKKDNDKVRVHHNNRGTSTDDTSFLRIRKVGSGSLEQ